MMQKGILVAMAGVIMFPTIVFAQIPNDTRYDDLWYLPQVHAPEAWDITTGKSGVVVAVLDTGISFDHTDLTKNIWTNTDEVPGNGKDDDNNGYIDDIHGWDFVDDDALPEPVLEGSDDPESQSHGTMMAGIIGAVGNNHEGYAGIAWNVRIMPVRILNNQGMGSESDVAQAIRYAIKNGADVINLSFVGDEIYEDMRGAIREAYQHNIVVVAALGNSAQNVNVSPVYPACLRSENEDWVIGVTASDRNDGETDFTNYGATCADIAAPGEGVYGLGYVTSETKQFDHNLYIGPWSGTSVASPIVAGAAALLRAAYPNISVDTVRSALKLSVDPAHAYSGVGALGAGRINIARALEVAAELLKVQVPVQQEGDLESEEDNATKPFADKVNSYIVLGARETHAPWVHVLRADGKAYASFLAFPEVFLGGVRVVADDLNDDNTVEVVATPGGGYAPMVKIFTVSGALIREFLAYEGTSQKGVNAALGDVTGDDVEEIVTAVGDGVSDDVVIFDQQGKELSRFAVTGFAKDTRFTVAVADVDSDWEKEIVVAAENGEPRVAIYNADGTRLVDFLAYNANMTAGLSVSAGDFDDDARDEIVVSPLAGGSAHIRMFNAIGALWGEFFASDVGDAGGSTVAVADIDVDGTWDIVTAPHAHGGDVRVWSAQGSVKGALQGGVPNEGAWMGAW